MAGRKYEGGLDKIYQAMLQRFRRLKLQKPGVLASFYLDVFAFGTKQLKSPEVYALGLAEQGTFTDTWREEQKKLGHLTWVSSSDARGRTIVQYKVGPKILKHINDAKLLADEVVTKTQFDQLAQRVEALELAMKTIIDIVDNPATDKKMKFYIENLDVLANSVSQRVSNRDEVEEEKKYSNPIKKVDLRALPN